MGGQIIYFHSIPLIKNWFFVKGRLTLLISDQCFMFPLWVTFFLTCCLKNFIIRVEISDLTPEYVWILMVLYQSFPVPVMLPFNLRFILLSCKKIFLYYVSVAPVPFALPVTSETPITIQILNLFMSSLHTCIFFSGYVNVFIVVFFNSLPPMFLIYLSLAASNSDFRSTVVF